MKIKKIKKIQPRKVYAITTTTGTFISDGLAHHNCFHCNINLSGNWVKYEEFMIGTYGKKAVEEMKKQRTLLMGEKVDVNWYKEKIEHYK